MCVYCTTELLCRVKVLINCSGKLQFHELYYTVSLIKDLTLHYHKCSKREALSISFYIQPTWKLYCLKLTW